MKVKISLENSNYIDLVTFVLFGLFIAVKIYQVELYFISEALITFSSLFPLTLMLRCISAHI